MHKILIAEDEQFMLKALEYRLKKDGYETITSSDGRDALSKINSLKPDIIITDIMMPYFTGLEILNFVKSNPETKDIPIIILSAATLEKTVLEAFNLGADDFVTKPFSPNELSIRIKKILLKR
jgi:DNA-binding response OmpR family regulator